jgi:hypothetical protein
MNLASTFILCAWNAHETRCRYKSRGLAGLAEYYEGKRDAFLFAARLCRDEAKAALAGRVER